MVGRKSTVSTEIIKYQTLRNLDLLERIDAIKAPSQKEQVLYGRVEQRYQANNFVAISAR